MSNTLYPNEIKIPKFRYTPALNGCRHNWLSSRREEQAKENAVKHLDAGESWEELEGKGWKIEKFDEDEYL